MENKEIFENLKKIRKQAPPELDDKVFNALKKQRKRLWLLTPVFATMILLFIFVYLTKLTQNDKLMAVTYIVELRQPVEYGIYSGEVPLDLEIIPKSLYSYTILENGDTLDSGEFQGLLQDTMVLTTGYHRITIKLKNYSTGEEQTVERVFFGL